MVYFAEALDLDADEEEEGVDPFLLLSLLLLLPPLLLEFPPEFGWPLGLTLTAGRFDPDVP